MTGISLDQGAGRERGRGSHGPRRCAHYYSEYGGPSDVVEEECGISLALKNESDTVQDLERVLKELVRFYRKPNTDDERMPRRLVWHRVAGRLLGLRPRGRRLTQLYLVSARLGSSDR